MKTLFYSLVFTSLMLQANVASAVDCTFEKLMVDSQNNSALDSYNKAWKEFEAQFATEKPAIQANASAWYPAWKNIAILAPGAFADGMKSVNPDENGVVPVNDLVRVVEETLSKKFPKLDVSVKPLVRSILNPDGSTKSREFNKDQYGEPQFEICVDDDKYNANIRLSVMCGTVTRIFVPDQQTFVQQYVSQVHSSQAINGPAALTKPFMAQYSAECANTTAQASPPPPTVASDAPVTPKQEVAAPAQTAAPQQQKRGVATDQFPSGGEIGGQKEAE